MAAGCAGMAREVVALAGGASMVAVFATVVRTELVLVGIYTSGVKQPHSGFVKACLLMLQCVVNFVKFALDVGDTVANVGECFDVLVLAGDMLSAEAGYMFVNCIAGCCHDVSADSTVGDLADSAPYIVDCSVGTPVDYTVVHFAHHVSHVLYYAVAAPVHENDVNLVQSLCYIFVCVSLANFVYVDNLVAGMCAAFDAVAYFEIDNMVSVKC